MDSDYTDVVSYTDAGRVLRSINNYLMRVNMQQAKKNGIDRCTMMHGWILGYLHHNKDKSVYQRDIERECAVTRSAVTSIVKSLEESGYIRRVEAEHDARLKRIVITDEGEAMNNKIIDSFKSVDKAMVKGVSDEDYKIFLKVCYQIKDNLHSLL